MPARTGFVGLAPRLVAPALPLSMRCSVGVMMKSAPASRRPANEFLDLPQIGPGSGPAVNWNAPRGKWRAHRRSPALDRACRRVERDHVVAAADMLAVDEDLRTVRPPCARSIHLGPPPRLLIEADLGEFDALLLNSVFARAQ